MPKYTNNLKLEIPEYTDEVDLPKLFEKNNQILDEKISIPLATKLVTSNNNELTIEDGQKITKFKIYGKSEQENEPTPTNPQEIKSIQGTNSILKLTNTKKNLLSITQWTFVQRGQIISGANTNELVLKTTNSDVYVNAIVGANAPYQIGQVGNFIPVKKGDILYFDTGNELFINNYFTLYDKNKVSLGYSSMLNNSNGSYEITNEDCSYVTFRFGYVNAVANQEYTLAPIVSKQPIDSYESYEQHETLINLQDDKLCSINNEKDELDVINGKGVKRIKELVLTGNENWMMPNSNVYPNLFIIHTTSLPLVKGNGYENNLLCSHFKWQNFDNVKMTEGICVYTQSSEFYIRLNKNNISTVEQLKTWLSNNPVTIQYELAEPEEFEIEPVNIELYEDTNNISLVEDIEITIECKYDTVFKGEPGNVNVVNTLEESSTTNAPSVNAVKNAIPIIEKIWENPNANNVFESQSITINNLNKYDFIILLFYNYKTNKAMQSIFMPVVNNNKFNMACTIYSSGNIHFGSREGTINTSNKTITFEQCHGGYISSTGESLTIDDNNWNIPYQIYGYSISR